MSRSVLILSPHCDDVPLSLGASLMAGLLGSNVKVEVVFSKSRYTKNEQGTARVRSTTATRMLEERRAARYANYKVDFLGYAEPFVRSGYKKINDIFDKTRQPENENCWQDIKDSLFQIACEHSGPILVPLGCGGHIDHRIVTTCFREIAPQLSSVIPVFYEDLPYAAWWTSIQIRDSVPDHWNEIPFVAVSLKGGSIEDKMRLIAIYESQIDNMYVESVRVHWDCRAQAEFIWMPQNRVNEFLAAVL